LNENDILNRIKEAPEDHGKIIWDFLTPFERERVFGRLSKNLPEIQSQVEILKEQPPIKMEAPRPIEQVPPMQKTPPAPAEKTSNEGDIAGYFERSVWDLKTTYQVAFADMIEQRTTIMEFLLVNFGIEAVEKFFLSDNPRWAEKLKVGKMKKIFAKIIAKLAPRMILNKLSDIILENAQYLVPLKHATINEASNDYKIIEITNCPVLKQFKKTIKSLNFSNIEERYICTFGCIPILNQMAGVGNCNVSGTYNEKGCFINVTLKAKQLEEEEVQAEDAKFAQIKNGISK